MSLGAGLAILISPLILGSWADRIGLQRAFVVVAAFALCHLFSGRGAYIHYGAMLGTIMVANVFFVIIPGQKQMVAAVERGDTPNGIADRFGIDATTLLGGNPQLSQESSLLQTGVELIILLPKHTRKKDASIKCPDLIFKKMSDILIGILLQIIFILHS